MATVSMFLPNLSGTTGLTLYLRKSSDYSLVNAGGDALTESATSGWFTATVAEAWTETLSATVIDGDGLVPAAGWLGVGSLIVSDVAAVLDSATQALINDIPTNAELTAALAIVDDATLAAIAVEAVKTTAIKVKTDQLAFTVANQVDANALTGGSATLANQTTIITHLTDIKGTGWSATTDTLKKIRDAISNWIGTVVVTPGPVLVPTGMPETLEIGDSYENGDALLIYIRDSAGDPVTAAAGHDFTDGDFAPTCIIAPTPGNPRGRVVCNVSYVVPGGVDENYLKVEIPSSQSKRAVEGESSVQIVLKWDTAQKTLLNTTVRWLPRI